jgi:hypothetical protein
MLLFHCNVNQNNQIPGMIRLPGPNSVLLLDNGKIHHNERLQNICDIAGALLFYLYPYSPDFAPMEITFKFMICILYVVMIESLIPASVSTDETGTNAETVKEIHGRRMKQSSGFILSMMPPE